jgi:membrane associated rhomboid family serine protease
MGFSDRDYASRTSRDLNGGGGLSVVGWLIFVNAAFYLIQVFLFHQASRVGGAVGPDPLFKYGFFSTERLQALEVWRLVTFQFLHGGMMHLAFNMLGLWSFGRMVEQYLGGKRFLAFYLVCGIFGALMYLVLNLGGFVAGKMGWKIPFLLINSTQTPLVGASAGVFGVIMAAAYLAPNTIVQLLFPPVPLRLRTMAYTFIAIAALSVAFNWKNAGGEAAHIGGALAGAFFIRRHYLLRDFFDVLDDSRKEKRSSARRQEGIDRARRELEELNREVDRILDKQREHGIHSLTDAEQKSLRKATQMLRRRGSSGGR